MKIPLFKIYWEQDDIDTITNVIKNGLSWATGPNVELFEKKLAKYVGTKYALTFNSGTSALHALMIYYGFKKGDEVIVPSFTFIATSNSVLMVGAKPVFAEIEEETLGLDPKDVEKKINRNTKAIIAVHIGGDVCKINELKTIADKHGIILIEDACESLGAKLGDKMVGNFGDCGVLSFCANKIITTGEGGAVVCNSKKMYNELKLIRSHGRPDTKNYFVQPGNPRYTRLGYNWRMSNLLASLGVSQLNKIDKIIKMRREVAKELIGKIKDGSVYQMLIIRSDQRDKLKRLLNKKMIGAKIYFNPIHLTDFYQKLGYKNGSLPITEKISKQVLSLPIYPSMTKSEIEYIKTIWKK